MTENKKTAAKPKKTKKEKIVATVAGSLPLNIRQDPSKEHAPLGTLNPGSEIEILEIGDEWCRIPEGYVMKQYLQL